MNESRVRSIIQELMNAGPDACATDASIPSAHLGSENAAEMHDPLFQTLQALDDPQDNRAVVHLSLQSVPFRQMETVTAC